MHHSLPQAPLQPPHAALLSPSRRQQRQQGPQLAGLLLPPLPLLAPLLLPLLLLLPYLPACCLQALSLGLLPLLVLLLLQLGLPSLCRCGVLCNPQRRLPGAHPCCPVRGPALWPALGLRAPVLGDAAGG